MIHPLIWSGDVSKEFYARLKGHQRGLNWLLVKSFQVAAVLHIQNAQKSCHILDTPKSNPLMNFANFSRTVGRCDVKFNTLVTCSINNKFGWFHSFTTLYCMPQEMGFHRQRIMWLEKCRQCHTSSTLVHWPSLMAVYCTYMKQMRLSSTCWQHLWLLANDNNITLSTELTKKLCF